MKKTIRPIRILHVVTYMGIGGLETMLMNYYRYIDRSKIQFDFLVHRQERWEYDDEIESLGGRIYRIRKLNPFSYLYKKQLKDFFTNHPEYKIIHVHQDCLSSIILKQAKKCGIPCRIAHSHSSNQDKNFKYIIKLYYRQLIPRYATELMACSQEAGEWMFQNNRFSVMNNSINVKQYTYNRKTRERIRKSLNIWNDEIVVGHVGRLENPKNHTFLLDIFHVICKKLHSKLIIVGDGSMKDQIERKIKTLGIQDSVIMTGIRTDIADLLQAMDVFVFPSLYEGLPLTLIEAQASGLPCVISDKVPIECKKTELVQQVSLNDTAEYWAMKSIEMSKMKRENTYEQIKNAGFDINENAAELQKYYLTQYDKKGRIK